MKNIETKRVNGCLGKLLTAFSEHISAFIAVIIALCCCLFIMFCVEVLFFASETPSDIGLTEIEYYYDYIDEENYEMITVKRISGFLGIGDSYSPWYLEEETFYVDDFGKFYKVTQRQTLSFKTTITKTEIKSKHENGVILAVVDGRVICSCNNAECPHQKLKGAINNGI